MQRGDWDCKRPIVIESAVGEQVLSNSFTKHNSRSISHTIHCIKKETILATLEMLFETRELSLLFKFNWTKGEMKTIQTSSVENQKRKVKESWRRQRVELPERVQLCLTFVNKYENVLYRFRAKDASKQSCNVCLTRTHSYFISNVRRVLVRKFQMILITDGVFVS